MMNIFDLSLLKTDASVRYLSQIFGNVNGVLPQGGSNGVLGTMFQFFNTMILVIAVMMLVYITVIGIIGTAHEGEFMGKKMNNIWIPIRAVLGIALLVPTGTGYCGIQIAMMWVIAMGISAADNLWLVTLGYVNANGNVYSQVNIPVTGADTAFQGVFKGLVCDASNKMGDPKNLGNYNCTSPSGCGGPPAFDPSKSSYDIPNCGSLTYCNPSDPKGGDCVNNPNQLKCLSCQAQINTLAQMIPTLAGIAQSLVNADYSYQDFIQNSWNNSNDPDWKWIYNYCSANGISPDQCCFKGYGIGGTCKATPDSTNLPAVNESSNSPQSASSAAVKNLYWPYWPQLEPALGNTDFIGTAVTYYQSQVNQAFHTYTAANGTNNNGTLINSTVNNAKNSGWIYAGALYYQIAALTSTTIQGAVTSLTWNPASNSSTARNNMDAAGYLMAIASGDSSQGAVSSPASTEVSSAMGSLTSSFQTNVNTGGLGSGMNSGPFTGSSSNSLQSSSVGGGSDPLLTLQVFGTIMMVTAEVLFFVAFVLVMTLGIASSIDIFVLGTGMVDPLSNAAIMITIFLVPLFWAALGLLVSAGALLAIYTPLLPYIYFTFGALAWIIATVEAMVAGPLVALGIISPSGQHEIMGKAEPALLLLFNLFLRPSLMIFGLIVAMLLASVACGMVNDTFAYVMLNWAYPDPLTMIFMLVAYVSLILAILNKCFAVINLIPQQVIRWIGGHGDAVETPTGDIKGGIDSASGQLGGGMSGTGERGKAARGEQQRLQAKKDKADAAASSGAAKDSGGQGVSKGGGDNTN